MLPKEKLYTFYINGYRAKDKDAITVKKYAILWLGRGEKNKDSIIFVTLLSDVETLIERLLFQFRGYWGTL